MKPLDDHQLERLLTPQDDPQPPSHLLERIKAEIPTHLGTGDTGGTGIGGTGIGGPGSTALSHHASRQPFRRWLPLAATVLVALGAAMLAWRVRDDVDPRADRIIDEASTVGTRGEASPATDSSPSEPTYDELVGDELIAQEAAVDRTLQDPPLAATVAPRPVPASVDPPDARQPAPSERPGEEAVTAIVAAPLLDEHQVTANDPREPPTVRSLKGLETAMRMAPPAVPPPAADSLSGRGGALRRERTQTSTGIASWAPARPQGEPYDTTYFKDYGTNPFIDTEDDALSTFALDVDTASYNVVRRFLRDGHRPDPASVRVEELINAFDYRDAPPEVGDFAVHIEAAPSPFGGGNRYHLVRFALKAREIADRDRPPVDLILVVDTSGSMARGGRLGLVKTATRMLLGELGPRDRVGLVAYSEQARIALLPTRDFAEVEQCLRQLQATGSTNVAAGLRLGYRLAADYRREGTTSRVMLLSDGVANVGNTSASGMLDEVARHAAAGVELTTVGVGMGNFNDVLLEQLADRGDGRYVYVDDRAEAHRVFAETLSGTLTTVASEAKVQVAFNPEVVARYRLIGYENRAVADHDFRDDRVDAGEVGAGHTVVALYEVKLTPPSASREALATLHLRYRSPARGRVIEERHTVRSKHVVRRFRQASPAFRLTALVAEAAEIFGESYWAQGSDLRQVLRETEALRSAFSRDERVADWIRLLERATHLLPGGEVDD